MGVYHNSPYNMWFCSWEHDDQQLHFGVTTRPPPCIQLKRHRVFGLWNIVEISSFSGSIGIQLRVSYICVFGLKAAVMEHQRDDNPGWLPKCCVWIGGMPSQGTRRDDIVLLYCRGVFPRNDDIHEEINVRWTTQPSAEFLNAKLGCKWM